MPESSLANTRVFCILCCVFFSFVSFVVRFALLSVVSFLFIFVQLFFVWNFIYFGVFFPLVLPVWIVVAFWLVAPSARATARIHSHFFLLSLHFSVVIYTTSQDPTTRDHKKSLSLDKRYEKLTLFENRFSHLLFVNFTCDYFCRLRINIVLRNCVKFTQ